MKPLILYSRPGCHLCETLLEEIEPLVAGKAVVEIVDIGRDADLTRRYGLRIPVLAGSEGEVSAYPLDRERLLAYLEARADAPGLPEPASP